MLTVHVGLHKTGSTSIQTVLGLERGHIRRRQVYLRWNDLFVTDGAITTIHVDKIVALSRRGWHVVVSSEGALGPMAQAYPHAAEVAEELARLFAHIPLRMVAYLRPHHEWAASALRQWRAEGGGGDADAFAHGLLSTRGFHHTSLVQDLTDALPAGGLTIRPYEHRMDVVQDFFSHSDLGEVPPVFADFRVNRSWAVHSGVSPFSSATYAELRRHFRADWSALSKGDLPAAVAVRSDLLQLLEGDVTSDKVDVAHVDDAAAADSPARPRESRVSGALQASAWRLRHGPRHALLAYLVARDAYLASPVAPARESSIAPAEAARAARSSRSNH